MISCTMVKLDLCYISCNSHPLLCFIAETNEKNKYPVPGHFQFSGRDGTGRDGTGQVPGSRQGLIVTIVVRNLFFSIFIS